MVFTHDRNAAVGLPKALQTFKNVRPNYYLCRNMRVRILGSYVSEQDEFEENVVLRAVMAFVALEKAFNSIKLFHRLNNNGLVVIFT